MNVKGAYISVKPGHNMIRRVCYSADRRTGSCRHLIKSLQKHQDSGFSSEKYNSCRRARSVACALVLFLCASLIMGFPDISRASQSYSTDTDAQIPITFPADTGITTAVDIATATEPDTTTAAEADTAIADAADRSEATEADSTTAATADTSTVNEAVTTERQLDPKIRNITDVISDFYLAGLAVRDSLGLRETVDFWEYAYLEGWMKARPDPRIGFRFVEFVVAKGDTGRYTLATEMYFWGLKAGFEEKFTDAIQLEMKMMEPLLERHVFRQWNRYFTERAPRLLREIRDYWIRHDILPSTERNERLIEHWQRIHYSRNHFTNDTSTIYGADARSEIYVRLGPPDRQRSGTLPFNSGEIRGRLHDLVEAGYIPMSQTYTLQSSIMRGYIPGRYDFWRYDNVSPEGPVIYLFGRPGQENRYRLMDSLDDFITGSNFRQVVLGRRGTRSAFRAGYFLQLMLYNEAATIDHYFGTRLVEYERVWNEAVFRRSADARMIGERNSPQLAAHDMKQIQIRAPLAQSSFERDLAGYPIYTRQYRFLDHEKGPVTFILVQPSEIFERVIGRLDDHIVREYDSFLLRQGIIVYQNGEKTSRHTDEHVAGRNDPVFKSGRFFSYGTIPVPDSETRFHLFSELYVSPDAELSEYMPNGLVALTTEWKEAGEPIADLGELQLSDLVLGTSGTETITIRSAEMGVLNNYRIPAEEDLQVYFEIYNLNADEAGEHRYTITYRLRPQQRRGLFRRRAPEVSLSWEAASRQPADYQFFEVDLSHVGSGRHRLHISVEDGMTGQKEERYMELYLEGGD